MLARRYHAALGMGPAQQRFTGGTALGAQVVERLIVHLKGVRREGIAPIELQIAPRVRLHVHTLLKKLPGTAAVQLAAVEGHIGVLQKQVGAIAIARCHGYADAGADHNLVPVDLERPAEHIHDLLGQGRTFIEVTQRILQHDELVAAEARDHIGSAYDAAQPVGYRAELGVTTGVAQGVVDLLEVVEVHEQDGERAAPLQGGERGFGLIVQESPGG
jgi:hypothetical protein